MHPDDEASFRAFVAERSGSLLHTARLLTGDLTGAAGTAEDLLQEALSRVVPRWGALDNPEAYTRTVLHRLQISRWRRRRFHEVPLPLDLDGFATPDPARAVDDRLLLQRALLALTPRQRSVLVCRYLEDLDERQTSERLGIGIGSVRSIGSRSLARLRDVLPPTLLTEVNR
ncbi:SigE family RNA polymerase sigma factor [Spongisporangium articulatum]|uniref:SigE family RNA polymerase sigma factor n=1 Tax=Spongisporangium articulatum TaxID=3362603 RepID=A0ABW8AGX1_9ACTN